MLDGIEDPHNVGAILRTVDAAAETAWCGRRDMRRGSTGQSAKASAGALAHVKHGGGGEHRPGHRRTEGSGDVGRSGSRANRRERYDGVDLTLPTAIVVGAEGAGLRRLVRGIGATGWFHSDAGARQSLNVSVAAGVVLFEAVTAEAG